MWVIYQYWHAAWKLLFLFIFLLFLPFVDVDAGLVAQPTNNRLKQFCAPSRTDILLLFLDLITMGSDPFDQDVDEEVVGNSDPFPASRHAEAMEPRGHKTWLPVLSENVTKRLEGRSLSFWESGTAGWLRVSMGCRLNAVVGVKSEKRVISAVPSVATVVQKKVNEVVEVVDAEGTQQISNTTDAIPPNKTEQEPTAPPTPTAGAADIVIVNHTEFIYLSDEIILYPDVGVSRFFTRGYLWLRKMLLHPYIFWTEDDKTMSFGLEAHKFCDAFYWELDPADAVTTTSTYTTVTTQEEGDAEETIMDEIATTEGGSLLSWAGLMEVPLFLSSLLESAVTSIMGTPSADSIVGSLTSNQESRLQSSMILFIFCLVLVGMFFVVRLRYLKYTRSLNNVMDTRKKNLMQSRERKRQ